MNDPLSEIQKLNCEIAKTRERLRQEAESLTANTDSMTRHIREIVDLTKKVIKLQREL